MQRRIRSALSSKVAASKLGSDKIYWYDIDFEFLCFVPVVCQSNRAALFEKLKCAFYKVFYILPNNATAIHNFTSFHRALKLPATRLIA